jgi:hypothetical protein
MTYNSNIKANIYKWRLNNIELVREKNRQYQNVINKRKLGDKRIKNEFFRLTNILIDF